MRIAMVAMVRDVLDIMPAFVAHHRRLFDEMHMVDHRSVDGTREYLASLRGVGEVRPGRAQIHLLRYDQPGYYQAQISTAMVHSLLGSGIDWVFLLDADEFLGVSDRSDLEARIREAGEPLVSLTWRNLIPANIEDTWPFDPDQPFLTTPVEQRTSRGKVAISREFFAAHPNLRVSGGNHSVMAAPGLQSLSGVSIGQLLHVPVRSREQLLTKVRIQMESFRAADPTASGVAPHMIRMERSVVASGSADERELIDRSVLEYEGPKAPDAPRRRDLQERVGLPSISLDEVLGEFPPGPRSTQAATAGGDGTHRSTRADRRIVLGAWRAEVHGDFVSVRQEPLGALRDHWQRVISQFSWRRARRLAARTFRRLLTVVGPIRLSAEPSVSLKRDQSPSKTDPGMPEESP